MRVGTVLCFALVIFSAHAEDSTDANSTTTPEPPITTPSTAKPTTPPSTTTTTVPPAPPTEPTPAEEKYFVNDTATGEVCILADFAAQILITYENTAKVKQTATLNVVNATVDQSTSKCDVNSSRLELAFGVNRLVLHFINENNEKYVDRMNLTYVPSKVLFPGHPKIGTPVTTEFVNLTLFKTTDNQSYSCKADTAKNDVDDTIVNFTAVQVESFRKSKDQTFSQAQDCSTEKVSDLVPIAVGCALLALVLIVLIAYFIGRRRSRRLAYQSV